MSKRQSRLDRIEERLDRQAARIDDLYRLLELRGIRPPAAETGTRDAFFDELVQVEDSPLARRMQVRPVRRRATRLRVGDATGV
jgi:hypothetical protein